jgi:hypothetical protein
MARFSGSDNIGVAAIGDVMEIDPVFLLRRFFLDGIEDEAVRGSAGAFRGAGDAGLQFIGQADRGGGHGGLLWRDRM